MGIWRRGVVVGRTCGRKRMKKQLVTTNRHGKSIERKLRQLEKIIPGGGGGGGGGAAVGQVVVDMEALFQRIAVYIFLLESRVKLLKTVYNNLFAPDN